VKRGEVWDVNLDPTIGAEIRKIRPAIIVNRDSLAKLPLRLIVPLTAWNDKFAQAPWHVPIESTQENGLSKKSSADTFQVRSVSEMRLVRKRGRISEADMGRIESGLSICLALDG
jgi:mRNA interferase MazF